MSAALPSFCQLIESSSSDKGLSSFIGCPALAHLVYQLSCHGEGPYASLIQSSSFEMFTDQAASSQPSMSAVLSQAATKWAISTALDESLPQWKVSAHGTALFELGFDRFAAFPVADILQTASAAFASSRSKIIKSLVENTCSQLHNKQRDTLLKGNLVDDKTQLTGQGLCFCLSHSYQQSWHLITASLETIDAGRRQGAYEAMAVLWQLDCNRIYPFPLNPIMATVISALAAIGLVFLLQKEGYRYFILWKEFAAAVANSGRTLSNQTALGGRGRKGGVSESDCIEREGAIITETNFRLYIYGKNAILKELVQQFAQLDVVVCDTLACCRVTRRSFMNAAQRGIRADQVLSFLAMKAHPVMREATDSSLVPQSVCDQLRMWESEWMRVAAIPGCVVISGATDIVLGNAKILDIQPVAVSRQAVALRAADYEKMKNAM